MDTTKNPDSDRRRNAADFLAETISAMADQTRLALCDQPRPAPGQRGWWVLVVGRPLDPENFSRREESRDELRRLARSKGVKPGEFIWVWDRTGRAQLVAAAFDDQDKAQEHAALLKTKGLLVRVTREQES